MTDGPSRLLSVWVADWPVVALERPPDLPVAVLRANRVLAAGPVARAQGVVPGLRRREAQARCPSLELHDHDLGRDARVFERVLVAMEQVAPRLEVAAPGRCAVPTVGPSRLRGGDRALAADVLGLVREALADLGRPVVGVGVADGPRAAALAAEEAVARHDGRRTLVVPPGASAGFLATLPVGRLHPDPADPVCATLARLGLRTVGRFAALPAADVLDRFGPAGLELHQVATGQEHRRPVLAEPPADLSVVVEPDPPLERVEQAAFVVKAMAEQMVAGLAAGALVADQ
ncbi:MAG: DNA polymerase Y family protein, partial [Actinomycetes bacterium]